MDRNCISWSIANFCREFFVKQTVVLLVATLFLFYSVFPPQFAAAWFADCGPHKVVNCETHDNAHLVLIKVEEHAPHLADHSEASKTTPHAHDDAHQINEKSPHIKGSTSQNFGQISAPIILSNFSAIEILNPKRFLVGPRWTSDPPELKSNLHLLSSVRIQV